MRPARPAPEGPPPLQAVTRTRAASTIHVARFISASSSTLSRRRPSPCGRGRSRAGKSSALVVRAGPWYEGDGGPHRLDDSRDSPAPDADPRTARLETPPAPAPAAPPAAPGAAAVAVDTAALPAGSFEGTDRFTIRRKLGQGGFGAVYEAHDRERAENVALKLLNVFDPAAIYRFKQEFRALADIHHPNLCALHELVSSGDRWFFTMELVPGTGFLEHVRGPALARAPGAAADIPRLRAAFRQLAEAVAALHAAGKLHRDLKPGNVIVTPDGRVVVLDFGLVAELGPRRVDPEWERAIVGTAAYMAPEQAAAQPVGPPADWYALGAILYQALTGVHAFPGGVEAILAAKQQRDAPRARAAAPSVPEDLDALCAALLARAPEARPKGAEVQRRLRPGADEAATSAADADAAVAAAAAADDAAPLLVGRERHLAALAQAFETVKAKRPLTLHLHGASGMGKSVLVRRFLDDLERRGEARVLRGRCYERESVPFKALDSLVDALHLHLLELPAADAAALLPPDIHALARLFPVLGRVEAVARASRPSAAAAEDAHELRHRAALALRELLARVAARVPLVLSIDDLQWGDRDSAVVLGDVLLPPDPPPLLLLGAYRTEEGAASPFLATLRAASPGATAPEIEIGPLSPEEATELATALIARHMGPAPVAPAAPAAPAPSAAPGAAVPLGEETRRVLASSIAHESHGSPFFVDELVEYLAEGGGTLSTTTHISLEQVLKRRFARLPAPARRLLEVVAIAGRPTPDELAFQASTLGPGEARPALAALMAAHLVRVRGARRGEARDRDRDPERDRDRDRDRVECHHDRIRETLVASLSPEAAREHHLRLAVALEACEPRDPDALALHYAGAGDATKAPAYVEQAADRAARALAFDNAARLYRLALDMRPPPPPGGGAAADLDALRSLRTRLGDALANSGRGAEAAKVYLAAAEGAKGGAAAATALDLRRRAAEQLLLSGRTDDGLAVMDQVLRAVGFRLARSRAGALLSLLLRTALLRLRGIGFTERPLATIPAEDLSRVDVLWSAASALSHVDLMRAAELQARHLLLALRCGEASRAARALALEGAYSALAGTPAAARTDRLVRAAAYAAVRSGQRPAIARAILFEAGAALFLGRFRRCLEGMERGLAALREGCTDVTFEIETAKGYLLSTRWFLGEWRELMRRLPAILRDAHERGDLYTETYIRCQAGAVPHWAADEPGGAFEELREALERGPRGGATFLTQHWWNFWGEVQTALYTGPGPDARRRLEARWPLLAGSLLLRVQLLRIESLRLRAAGALAAAAALPASRASAEREALLCAAERDAARIERERLPYGDPIAALLKAGVAASRGRPEEAVARLVAAESGFTAAEMSLHAAVARRRRGELQGGDEGRGLVAFADARFRAESVKDPARMAGMLAPGF